MGTINLTMGSSEGTFTVDESVTFTISSAQTINVTITGKDQQGSTDSWFTPNPATILAGKTSVSATAAQVTPIGEYVTYMVTGMNVPGAAHVHVGSSMREDRVA